MALNHESNSFEQRHAAAAERLQRMHRAGHRAETSERREHAIIQCATGVQYNFTPPFFTAGAREPDGDVANGIIGRGDQDYAGIEHAARESAVRMPAANRTHSRTRGGRGACDNRTNAPPAGTEAASERATDTSSADDCNRGHLCAAHPQQLTGLSSPAFFGKYPATVAHDRIARSFNLRFGKNYHCTSST
jgi:hypothetical protein